MMFMNVYDALGLAYMKSDWGMSLQQYYYRRKFSSMYSPISTCHRITCTALYLL